MRSDGVVVLHNNEDVAQVLLAYHNNIVEAFPANRADQTRHLVPIFCLQRLLK
jgi:chorismate mutase